MDSAVDTLNKTYSGQAGLLTRTVPKLKDLTAEQLKHGGAVKTVAEQYKGMAKNVADATGYPQKLANAWGDLKEQVGMGFTALFAPAAKFFTWAIEKCTAIAQGMNEVFGIATGAEVGDIKASETIGKQLDEAKAKLSEMEDLVNNTERRAEEAQKRLDAMGASEKDTDEARAATKALIAEAQEKITAATRHTAEAAARENELLAEQEDISKKILALQAEGGQDEAISDLMVRQVKVQKDLKNAQKETAKANEELFSSQDALERQEAILQTYGDTAEGIREKAKEAEAGLEAQRAEVERLKKAYADEKKAEADAQNGEKVDAARKRLEAERDARQKNADALKRQLQGIKEKYDLEEKTTGVRNRLSEAQEVLNAKESSYLSLLSSEEANVNADSALAKERVDGIMAQVEAVKALADEETKRQEAEKRRAEASAALEAAEALNAEKTAARHEEANKILEERSGKEKDAKDILIEQQAILGEMIAEYTSLLSSTTMTIEEEERYKAGLKECKDAIKDMQSEIDSLNFDKALENVQRIINTISSGMQQLTSTMQQGTDLALKQVEKDAQKDGDAAKDEYEAGIISYEEYQDKKEEIDKEAAQKEYKIKMAQWAMNFLLCGVAAVR